MATIPTRGDAHGKRGVICSTSFNLIKDRVYRIIVKNFQIRTKVVNLRGFNAIRINRKIW